MSDKSGLGCKMAVETCISKKKWEFFLKHIFGGDTVIKGGGAVSGNNNKKKLNMKLTGYKRV